MASILANAFFCCLGRKPSQSVREPPDEQTHLIPASTEPSPMSLPNALVVDHQKMKERMGYIVRSKEGKMVNVGARLPFNLHNRKISVNIGPSSSSRSASSSTNRPSLNQLSPLSSTPHSHSQVHAHVGAPLTPVMHPNPSRSSSRASRERENSAHDSENSMRTPVLNVRLVRGLPSGLAVSTRRGRTKKKAVDGSNGGSALANPADLAPADRPASLGSTDGTPTPRVHPLTFAPDSTALEPKPTLSISPASSVEFTLQDTGPLTVSWGD